MQNLQKIMDKIEFILNDKEELIEQNSSLLLLIKEKNSRKKYCNRSESKDHSEI